MEVGVAGANQKNRKWLFKTVGVYFKKARETKNISQNEAGRALGLSGQYVSNFERGITRPSNGVIRKLIKMYSLSTTEVVEDLSTFQRTHLAAELKGTRLDVK